jgi:hypothetical protein
MKGRGDERQPTSRDWIAIFGAILGAFMVVLQSERGLILVVQVVFLLPLVVAKQPESAVASSWWASVRPRVHSRHPQCSLQNGISVSVWAAPREPCLPAPALLMVTLPDLPVLWASDPAQAPSLAPNAAPNKLER